MAASTTNGAAAGKGFLIVDFDIKNMKLCYAWENTREQVDVDTLKGTELVVVGSHSF
ncbi:MAG: hypothetical protein L6R37_007633 [Teloschistes peruensis]|nr:MAG: hypothetical protein L6R37_007633 [Teloschistes peruensis]